MASPGLHQHLLSFRSILLLSIAIRVGLILYSEWHDAHSVVKYTDIDYRVFSDAARFLLHPDPANIAQGPLARLLAGTNSYNVKVEIGDPYTRATYRYTPLLALLLAPNVWLHPAFGKYLFAACDILNGVLIYRLLVSDILPGLVKRDKSNRRNESKTRTIAKSKTKTEATPALVSLNTDEAKDLAAQATLYASLHLLNPMVFTISTRGSSESILALLVLLTLHAALRRRWDAAALLLGIATHWKIYPVVYGVACLGVVGGGAGRSKGWMHTMVNARTVRFTLLSAGAFVALGAGCYLIWGYPFLYESYLYHVHRLDHRHNFSPYFYLTYLTYPSPPSSGVETALPLWNRVLRSSLASFGPQMGLALGTGLLFGQRKEDLPFAWFVQTVVFVVFNKVCTSQYFLWYLLLLPLILPRLATTRVWALAYVAVWVGTQALWLAEAYKLEFLGEDVFPGLWLRGLVYVLGNAWVLGRIMDDYVP